MTDALSITVGRKKTARFFHLGMKGKGGDYPRCICCGQIDEDGYHAAEYCPAIGPVPAGRYCVMADPENPGAWQVRAPEGFLVFTTETCGPQTLLQAQRVAAVANAELDLKAQLQADTATQSPLAELASYLGANDKNLSGLKPDDTVEGTFKIRAGTLMALRDHVAAEAKTA